jgi:Prolyl oligopeptidase, N-terminal beta-propeller domain
MCFQGPAFSGGDAYIILMPTAMLTLRLRWSTNLPLPFAGIASPLRPHLSPVSLRLRNMTSPSLAWTPHCYPPTRRSDHVDVYRSGAGVEVKVSDPYVWLEKDGEEQENWLAAQEALARNFLDSHPDRIRLEEEIRASTDYEKVSSSLMILSERM